MATDPNQIVEDDPNQPDPNADPNPNPDPNEGGDPDEGGDETPPEVAALAQEMGWKPKDQFDGPEDQWRPAGEFIKKSGELNRGYRSQIDALHRKIDTIASTSASIVEQQVQERVQELSEKYNKAVDDGDPNTAFKLANEIGTLTSQPPGQQAGPSPEAQSFAERNNAWFQKSGREYETARAIEISNMLQRQGVTDQQKQLQIVEQQMLREFPELFKGGMNGRKPPPGVNPPAGRTSGSSGRQKGFSDMPAEAQKIARDMADRGVIKDVADYAKNYFANEKAKG